MTTHHATPEAQRTPKEQAEYDRWFKRGAECSKDQFMSVFANLRAGTNAYWGFLDGFSSTHP